MQLENAKVAILATDGFEQLELTAPLQAIQDEGATAEIISLKSGQIQGFNHMDPADKFDVDKTVDQVRAEDYDGLILPGGVHNPDSLRTNPQAVQLVRDFMDKGKPVSAICHGPWLLAEADVLQDRKVTSFKSIKTDLMNAGANWVDKEVVVDNGLTTSRNPDDLKAFCDKTVEEIAEGRH